MTSVRSLFSVIVIGLAFVSASSVVGCSAATSEELIEVGGDVAGEEVASASDELSVSFKKINVQKSNAKAGLTLLRSNSEFRSFFGFNAPSNVDFKQDSVIHFSTGVKPSGGFGADITNVDVKGNRLTVSTKDTSPGPNCVVTFALTNPQVTVKVARRTGATLLRESRNSVVTNCAPVCPSPASFCDAVCNNQPAPAFPPGCPQPMCACPPPPAPPPDCTVTGCGVDQYCAPCRTSTGAVNICLSNGTAC